MLIKRCLMISALTIAAGLYSGCSDGSLFDISKGLKIYNAEDLKMIGEYPNENFTIMNDIDASSTADWNGGKGFKMISTYFGVCGIIEGNGHVIKNLYIENSNGFIDWMNKSGEIRNLGFENIHGLLVITNDGKIINCYTICSEIEIENKMYIAGLVAENMGEIVNCYSDSIITAENVSMFVASGSLAGSNYGQIRNSYSKGQLDLSGENLPSGGLVGINLGSVNNCYSITIVNVVSSVLSYGGFVGVDNAIYISEAGPGIMTSCFWDIETSGQSAGIGDGSSAGLTGLATAQMKTQSTYSGWDFDTVWAIDPDINDGYPYLREVPPLE